MLVVASGSGEPALMVANPMRFLHLKIRVDKHVVCKGTGEAPGLLREAGLLKRLRDGGCSVTDHGDLVSACSAVCITLYTIVFLNRWVLEVAKRRCWNSPKELLHK